MFVDNLLAELKVVHGVCMGRLLTSSTLGVFIQKLG